MASNLASLVVLLLAVTSSAWAQSGAAPRALECCSSLQGVLLPQQAGIAEAVRQRCMDASSLDSHEQIVMFFDQCRNVYGMGMVMTVSQCFAPFLPRAGYDALAFERDGLAREANVAAMVLGYGCNKNAKTSVCNGLRQLLVNDGSHVLGAVPRLETTIDGVLLNLTVNEVVRQCLSPTLGKFDDSEFNRGVAGCAVGTDIADYVVPRTVPTCSKCELSGSELPFCSPLFSSASTVRYGARCDRALIADRIAQTIHTAWMRTGEVNVGGTNLSLPVQGTCARVLETIACRTALGECESSTSVYTPCKSVCENSLISACSASSADAQAICMHVGATNTGASCPTLASSSIPTSAPASPSRITVASSRKRNMYSMTICLASQPMNDTILQMLVMSAVETECQNQHRGADCQIQSLNSTTTSQARCGYQITLAARVLSDAAPANATASSSAIASAASKQSGQNITTISVHQSSYSVYTVESANGSGSAACTHQMPAVFSLLLSCLSLLFLH